MAVRSKNVEPPGHPSRVFGPESAAPIALDSALGLVEERIHPHEKHSRYQAEADGKPRVRLEDRGDDPHAEVGQDDASDLPEAAAAIHLSIGGKVVLPALSVGGVCGLY